VIEPNVIRGDIRGSVQTLRWVAMLHFASYRSRIGHVKGIERVEDVHAKGQAAMQY